MKGANKNWCVRDEGSALQVFRVTDAAKLAAAPSQSGQRAEHTARNASSSGASSSIKMARSHELGLRFWGGHVQAKTVTRTGGSSTENPTAVA